MKILHTVEFYSPSVGGSQEVVRQLSERMVALGHDVTVATTKLSERNSKVINGVKVAEFDVKGNTVRKFEGRDIERYTKFLSDGKFDVMMNYAAQEWTADLAFGVLDRIRAKKVLVPCGYSGLYHPDYTGYFRRLPAILKKYDATVYLSNSYRDIEFARQHKITNTHFIPNGADEREFGLPPKPEAPVRRRHRIRKLLIVSIGNHTGEKGHRKAILAFLLAPFRDATLVIIGRKIHAGGCSEHCARLARLVNRLAFLTDKEVLLLDLDRQETVSTLKAADVFLFLSKIEASPLVLFEAAASGTPFVASDAGNSREIAEWTQGGYIVDGYPGRHGRVRPKLCSAIRILTRLARNAPLRRGLGQAGRQRWEERFTWDNITNQYLALYRGLLR